MSQKQLRKLIRYWRSIGYSKSWHVIRELERLMSEEQS